MVSDVRVETPNGASVKIDLDTNVLATGLYGTAVRVDQPNPELLALVLEHDDLDSAIAALSRASACDDPRVARLKKRKLLLRDKIVAKATDPCRTGGY